MLENLPFSEGARRVLSAMIPEGDAVGPPAQTLLAALWADGSMAAELLSRHGADESSIANVRCEAAPAMKLVLREAHRLAGRNEGETEIGTEHLLAALLNLWPGVTGMLGLTVGSGDDLLKPVSTLHDADAGLLAEPIQLREGGRPAQEQALLHRTLDAAANRCREGLRVVEDFVRFQLGDMFLSAQLKQLRHHLQRQLGFLGEPAWERHRDAAGDVGPAATRSLEAPLYRGTPEDVVRANCKRVEEALRTLEEFGKLIDVATTAQLERLRYEFYGIEKAISTLRNSRERLQGCRLYLLVTDRLCPSGVGPVVREAVASGVDVVQLREKEMPDRRLIELARHVREWTHEAGALFIVNDRPDVAALVGADGVHLGQDDMSVSQARRIVGGQALIGVSTHHIAQARLAILEGADYLGVGPVFPSTTKSFDDFPGLGYVREVAAETTLPWFPLGGIDLENLDQVLDAGATRIAVSGAIARAPNPGGAAQELARRLPSGTR